MTTETRNNNGEAMSNDQTEQEKKDDPNQELHVFCLEWADWHCSRRMFAPPIPPTILARLQPHRVGEPPNAPLSADLSYFNLSVLGQEECRAKLIFYLYYIHRVRHIKSVAEQMGISTSMWYREMREFRTKAHRAYRRMMEEPVENPFEELAVDKV